MDSSPAGDENAEVVPEALHTFFRGDGQVLGHLAIDSRINGLCAGGIRVVPEMSAEDLCHLARTMTLKYAFLKLPFGGAKAAILLGRAEASGDARARHLRRFGEQLAVFRGKYWPGEDAGTNADDLRLLNEIARLDRPHRGVDSGYHTATTVRICIQQMARELLASEEGRTVAIEGLGKVGGAVARQLAGCGCRIVAVSTAAGALYHPGGLDVEKLMQIRETAGDDCVRRYEGATRIDRGDVFGLQVDFLVPCALSWSIREANADALEVKAIVCGANNPVTEKARVRLAARGIVYVPDFVSSCGGVLGSVLAPLCRNDAHASRLLAQQFQPKVTSVLNRCRNTGQSLEAAAAAIAQANRERMLSRRAAQGNRLFALAAGALRRGLLPQTLLRLLGPACVRRMMT
jgi:glutamate dehydrogenase/leucine dehydrogenase